MQIISLTCGGKRCSKIQKEWCMIEGKRYVFYIFQICVLNIDYWCCEKFSLNTVYSFVVAIAVGGYILRGKLWKWECLHSLWLLFGVLKVFWLLFMHGMNTVVCLFVVCWWNWNLNLMGGLTFHSFIYSLLINTLEGLDLTTNLYWLIIENAMSSNHVVWTFYSLL